MHIPTSLQGVMADMKTAPIQLMLKMYHGTCTCLCVFSQTNVEAVQVM